MGRFIVYGAGGIGGTVGANLFMHDREVVLITRGAHRDAIASKGLRYETPAGAHTLQIPVVGHPDEIEFRDDDVVLMTMKLQDSEDALRTLALLAPHNVSIICMQNGIDGERSALRHFRNVYGCLVVCQAEFVEPGLVLSRANPEGGSFGLGRYPIGTDDRVHAIADEFNNSNLIAHVREDIMAWKRTKLYHNLISAEKVLMGNHGDREENAVVILIRKEAEAVYEAAGLSMISDEEFYATAANRALGEIPGRPRHGSSAWQSFVRGTGNVETDYLNGEIVFLGRLYGVPTPANELVQNLANEFAAKKIEPGTAMTMEDFLKRLNTASV